MSLIPISSFLQKVAQYTESGSRLSATRVSETSRPSIQRSAKQAVSPLRPGGASAVSLLWPARGSAIFRTVKTGFKVPRYQNSYRLGPFNPFNCEVVEKILDEVMNVNLRGTNYDPAVCMKLCRAMSSEVRSRIDKKDFDR